MSIPSLELRTFPLFAGLSGDDLALLCSLLVPCDFLPEVVILTKESPADAIFFILKGVVRVELRSDNGEIFNLLELGPGEIFGERAVLTDEPRTADVRAVTAVTVGRLPRAEFEVLLHRMPGLYANLCRYLARQLGSWAQRHYREEQMNRDVLSHVVGWHLLPEFDAFPGSSPWIRSLNLRLQELGGQQSHVLIEGEAGTWKDLAARLIHFYGNTNRPILFLDCATPPPLVKEAGGEGAQLLENGQRVALFGDTAGRGVVSPRRGMIDLARGGEMILRNIDCLQPQVQLELLACLLKGQDEGRGFCNLVRIIATSSKSLKEKVAEGSFDSTLCNLISAENIVMLPLRERKKDIPVIARRLLPSLNAKHRKEVRRLSPEAVNRLLDHDWPLNGSELYQVLSRAVLICDGDKILAEHISLNGQFLGGGRFNLLALPVVANLTHLHNFPRLLRIGTVPVLLVITLYLLLGPVEPNPANLVVWTIWWPALLLSSFVFARGWCSCCPLEAIGEYVGTKTRVKREPQEWLRRWGGSLSLVVLILILLVESVTRMLISPAATGFLLLVLIVATASSDLLLGRRGWCKYICPLGRIVGIFARISLIEMRSNQNVCTSRCQVDDCIKEKGCPMELHPAGINNSDHCILCMNCVRSCPHQSMQLEVRSPVWGLFNRARRDFPTALFSVSLIGAVLSVKTVAPYFAPVTPVPLSVSWNPAEFACSLLVVVLYAGTTMLLSFGKRRKRWVAEFTIYGNAYLPLAYIGIFFFYFRGIIERGADLVPQLMVALGIGGYFDLSKFTPELGTLRLVIAPLVVLGAIFSWCVLGHFQKQYALNRYAVVAHKVYIFLTSAAFLWLL